MNMNDPCAFTEHIGDYGSIASFINVTIQGQKGKFAPDLLRFTC